MAEHTTYHATRPARCTSAPRRVAWCLAAALTVMAGAAVAPPVAGADAVRTVALHRGVTAVNLTVPHVSGARPPAILLSLTRASGRCSVARYSYIDHERRARFRTWIRCPRARRGARVKLVFRAPLQRRFRLRNGVGTVRVVVDKPPRHRAAHGRAEDTTRRSRLPRHAIARVHGRPSSDGDGACAVPWSAGQRKRRPHGRRTDRSRRAGRSFEVVTDGERHCECGGGVDLPGL